MRMKTGTTLLLGAALTLSLGSAHADGLQDLERFLSEVNSVQADFTQVVTSPRRVGEETSRSKTSSGRFELLRPNRFRFEYRKPFEQSIVADGQTVWLYDVDMNQVTARSQAEALGSTPVALIAGGKGSKALSEAFELKALPAQGGMNWLEATPRTGDGQLKQVKVGFKDGQIAALEITDSLGQLSQLTFSQWQSNMSLPADRFRFTPPAGADVIRQ
jgi:outer membrane lipoprotein carrier protein